VRERLGLKLESAKGPVDVLIIDHVERPSPIDGLLENREQIKLNAPRRETVNDVTASVRIGGVLVGLCLIVSAQQAVSPASIWTWGLPLFGHIL
jgi:Protein of unknown function (DUF3738)